MKGRPATFVSVAIGAVLAAQALAADKVRIVDEGGIRDEWMLADGVKLGAPGYPADFKERGDSVCIAMGYAIKPDGTTSDFSVLKAWNSATGEDEPVKGYWQAFAQAGAQALSQWKFKPRPEIQSPRNTYTTATLGFPGKDAPDSAGLRSQCAIKDLATFVQKNKNNRFMNGRDKQELDAMQRQMRDAQQAAAAAAMMRGNAR